MPFVYILDDNEKYLIDNQRKLKAERAIREEIKKNCKHIWKYDGHSHNDDCFICTLCGETEFR